MLSFSSPRFRLAKTNDEEDDDKCFGKLKGISWNNEGKFRELWEFRNILGNN